MECHRGTIVANYDGANKHAAVSEDEAHTGSNSVLVALAGAAVGTLLAFRLERRKAKDDREAAASAVALDLAGPACDGWGFGSPQAGTESTTTYAIFNLELQRGGTHGRASRAASALVKPLPASDFPSRSRISASP